MTVWTVDAGYFLSSIGRPASSSSMIWWAATDGAGPRGQWPLDLCLNYLLLRPISSEHRRGRHANLMLDLREMPLLGEYLFIHGLR